MDYDFKKIMSNKSDTDLADLENNYLKYTKDALVAYLEEIELRALPILKAQEIKNRILELEAQVPKFHVYIKNPIPIHPNILRASKLILLSIPLSIIDIVFTIFDMYKIIDWTLFRQMASLLTLSLIFSWLIILLASYWIKSGTTLSRIVIGFLIGCAVLSTSFNVFGIFKNGVFSIVYSFIMYLIEIYILFLLFNKETSKWYKESKIESVDTPKVD